MIKWSFDPDALFERLNSYLTRLHDVNEIIVAANDFLKLEKIEIGGIKGRHLSERIHGVLGEFQNLYNTCVVNHTNLLEPTNEKFNVLKRRFQSKLVVLERKLSQIFTETFLNCNCVETSIKVVEMFGSLLQRTIIKDQISGQIHTVIKDIGNELNIVEILFNSNSRQRQMRVK